MEIIAFVPIKMTSSRLPNKNILLLGEKPLCWHIFDTLLKIKDLKVCVFCSTDKIMDFIPSEVEFIQRPKYLDGDLVQGMEIYDNFVNQVDSQNYLLAHATSPFISETSIQKGIYALNAGHDSAFSAIRQQTFAWYQDKPINYSIENIPRTQELEPVWIETSGFFTFSKEVINSGTRIGKNPSIIEVNALEGLDIDELEDYEMALRYV